MQKGPESVLLPRRDRLERPVAQSPKAVLQRSRGGVRTGNMVVADQGGAERGLADLQRVLVRAGSTSLDFKNPEVLEALAQVIPRCFLAPALLSDPGAARSWKSSLRLTRQT